MFEDHWEAYKKHFEAHDRLDLLRDSDRTLAESFYHCGIVDALGAVKELAPMPKVLVDNADKTR